MPGILTRYIQAAMEAATYKTVEDGSFLAEILPLNDVWAHDTSLEQCRRALQSVLERWIVQQLCLKQSVPAIGEITLDWTESDPEEDATDLQGSQEVLATLEIQGTVRLSEILSNIEKETAVAP